MSDPLAALSPRQAWLPLPRARWDGQAAAHLLRRAGFSARWDDVRLALEEGMDDTLERLYDEEYDFSVPQTMWDKQLEIDYLNKSKRGAEDEERRAIERKIREARNEAYRSFAYEWLSFARQPEHSAQEKHVLFLESVFVVGHGKLQNPGQIYDHQNVLRRGGYGSYRDLTKEISRSPAMIRYLDLQGSHKKAPNENFARELFELFTLGEGHYTEADIKEAARAFTGYGIKGSQYYFSEFQFQSGRYDGGSKTVFGREGRWNGDEVIEIVFEQPAARRFHVRELLHYYVTEDPLPEPYVDALGEEWARHDYDQRWLLKTVLGSQLFYLPAYRGNLIKSPIQYYLGLCQDLNLDVIPVPERLLTQLRNMGQRFQDPPNVRGWVGGRHWINASTLTARQQLVRYLFFPPAEKSLNADERRQLTEAREDGLGPFYVQGQRLEAITRREPGELINYLCRYFLPIPPDSAFEEQLVQHLSVPEKERPDRTRQAVVALLQSPAYQLC